MKQCCTCSLPGTTHTDVTSFSHYDVASISDVWRRFDVCFWRYAHRRYVFIWLWRNVNNNVWRRFVVCTLCTYMTLRRFMIWRCIMTLLHYQCCHFYCSLCVKLINSPEQQPNVLVTPITPHPPPKKINCCEIGRLEE